MTAYRPAFATLSFDTLRLVVARWAVRREFVQLLADDDLLVSSPAPTSASPT